MAGEALEDRFSFLSQNQAVQAWQKAQSTPVKQSRVDIATCGVCAGRCNFRVALGGG